MYARTTAKRFTKRTTRSTRAKVPATRARRPIRRYKRKGNPGRLAGSRGAFLGITRPTVQRGYLPFNNSYMARLPYLQDGYIAISAAEATAGTAVVNHTYRMNSLYDPEFTVGGGQPFAYDQLCMFFLRYQVYACKVYVTFYNPLHDGMNVGVRLRVNSNEQTTQGMSLTQLGVERRTILRQINNTGSQRTTISFYIKTRDIFGVNATQYQDLTYSSVVTQNPPSLVPLLEPFALATVAGETSAVRYSAKIIYYAKFWEPITFGPS